MGASSELGDPSVLVGDTYPKFYVFLRTSYLHLGLFYYRTSTHIVGDKVGNRLGDRHLRHCGLKLLECSKEFIMRLPSHLIQSCLILS